MRKILIADDSPTARKHIKDLLNSLNFKIVEAEDGEKALEAIEKENPDLILLDLSMPKLNGFEVLERISQRLKKEFLPVVVITGDERKDVIEKAFDLGAVDFIVKPPSEVELKSRINAHLRTKNYYEEVVRSKKKLEMLMKELKIMSITDPLTGLYNRLFFNERLKEEYERAKRLKIPFSLLMIDIDHFKRVNDTYGHDVGDKVLVETARTIRENVRRIDIVSRYGGEEFTVILLRTVKEDCIRAAERLRSVVEKKVIQTDGSKMSITISIGCTTFSGYEDVKPEDLLKRSDEALYKAKNAGRNRVVFLPV